MENVSYTHLRENLKEYLDNVCQEHVPIKVKRNNGENCILLSEGDYESLIETMHLLSSRETTDRILEANERRELYDLKDVKKSLNL